MNLAQYPVGPRGSPDDPLADPYDDPSYRFNFRTPDQSRTEENDAIGRVRGLYSYIDDIGERHSVRYAAGAGTGFEVLNAVPDSPANVGYTSPLYKAPAETRGRMTVQRGPNGSYKLIAAGPDHRRAESRASDGLVRGTFSYLDDKGVQRTVEYIAGAGIGYRVLKNRVGPGTHINPSVTEFRLSDTDFKLANDFGSGAAGGLGASESGSTSSNTNRRVNVGTVSSSGSDYLKPAAGESSNRDSSYDSDVYDNDVGSSSSTRRGGSGTENINRVDLETSNRAGGTTYRDNIGDSGRSGVNKNKGGAVDRNRGSTSTAERGSFRPKNNRNGGESTLTRFGERDRSSANSSSGKSSSSSGSHRGSSFATKSHTSSTNVYSSDRANANNYNFNDDDVGSLSPLITANRKILEIDRERDWVERHRDSTVIKNVGKWYIGLPAGHSVRAHVQNIDLIPLGGRRGLSPSEALRQDEIADMVASYESGTS